MDWGLTCAARDFMSLLLNGNHWNEYAAISLLIEWHKKIKRKALKKCPILVRLELPVMRHHQCCHIDSCLLSSFNKSADLTLFAGMEKLNKHGPPTCAVSREALKAKRWIWAFSEFFFLSFLSLTRYELPSPQSWRAKSLAHSRGSSRHSWPPDF